MGNAFSRRNKVQPNTSTKQEQQPKIPLRYRLLCCSNKVRQIAPQSTSPNSKASSISCQDVETKLSGVITQVKCQSDTETPVRLDFTVPRAQLYSNKTELTPAKKPLPDINGDIEKCIFRRRVKRDKYGNTTSVCYIVSFNGPPDMSYLDKDRPQRVSQKLKRPINKLPALENGAANARLSAALCSMGSLPESTLYRQKAPADRKLTPVMLERMEMERQRALQQRCEEKGRQAAIRKQRFKDKKAEGFKKSERRQKKTKNNMEEQNRNISLAAKESLARKMRAVKQRKSEMQAQAQEKQMMDNVRRMRAKLKSRGNITDNELLLKDKMEDGMFIGDNHDPKLSRKIHSKALEAQVKEGDKKKNPNCKESANQDKAEILRISDDCQFTLHTIDAHDDVIKDAFWDT